METGSKHEECSVCGYKNASVEIPVDKTNSDNPKTGDTTNMALWIALVMLSGGLLTVTAGIKRNRKSK